MTFEARDLAWSQSDPGNVVATVIVRTANPQSGEFTYPMEFAPAAGSWQLTRKTADLLLQFGGSCHRPAPPPRRPADPLPPTPRADHMWIGWLEFDILLGDVRSLKQKRSAVRPLIAELARRFSVSAAETGSQDLHRRAQVGIALVSADRAHVATVLDAAERLVAARPDLELLSARRGLAEHETS